MKTKILHTSSMMQSCEYFLRSGKLLRSLLLVLVAVTATFAQNPFKFAYQGVARDGAGNVIANTTVSVRVTIRENAPNGPMVYQQTESPQTNAAGIYNLVVGTNAFLNIDWASKEFFLQSELDPNGGANSFVDMGTTQLQSVPYALVSKQWMNGYPVVQKGVVGSGPTLSGVQVGANLIWYPRKAAFRAGALDVNGVAYWNDNGIGENSFATGLNVKASGEGSIAMGKYNFAYGTNAVAIGSSIFSNSKDAVALGRGTIVDGEGGVAIGNNVKAAGTKSLAMGSEGAMATGYESVSIGAGTVARAFGSVALGTYNNAQDPIGLNPSYDAKSRLFQIGNGINEDNRSNVMTILRNGNIGIGNNVTDPKNIMEVGGRMRLRYEGNLTGGIWLSDNGDGKEDMFFGRNDQYGGSVGFYSQLHKKWDFTVSGSGNTRIAGQLVIEQDLFVQKSATLEDVHIKGKLYQNSDRRLKRDITRLSGSMSRLAGLNGYNYLWKDKAKDPTLQTGVIAQEVEQLFPELITTDKDGIKSVNYVGLIPHLIEAVKELNKKNEAVSRLEKEVLAMKEIVAALKKTETSPKASSIPSK